ncbi:MAG: endonuclease III [Bdellovibrionia bacterium]
MAQAKSGSSALSQSKRALEKRELEKRRMEQILTILKAQYPDARCSLFFKTPFQLLIATILSAQCTDERVNQVTPALFQRFPTAQEMSQATLQELEVLIQSTGFFRSKARALKETSQALMTRFGGEIPVDRQKLVELRGVGRKTANVLLGVGYGIPAVVVDTHVTRLTGRLGFTRSKNAVQIEHQLMEVVAQQDWSLYALLMIDHGRKICTARVARCELCVLKELCPKKIDRSRSPA